MTPTVPAVTRAVIDDPRDADHAAQQLADGAIVAHGFANFYAITTRPDPDTVRRVNLLKGRPANQVGSITGPPADSPTSGTSTTFPTGCVDGRCSSSGIGSSPWDPWVCADPRRRGCRPTSPALTPAG